MNGHFRCFVGGPHLGFNNIEYRVFPNLGYYFGGSYGKDYSMLGSIYHYFGELPYSGHVEKVP